MCELHGATALVEQAVAAEEAGLDFVAMSDHIHPWLSEEDMADVVPDATSCRS